MPITFVRIDDRVIHGQVVARWSRFRPCDGILVVDDKIAHDPLQKKIFINAAPAGVKVGVFTVKESVERIKKAAESKRNYFIIVKSPVTLKNLLEQGADFGPDINVGPLSARSDTKTVAKNVSITEEEKKAFDYLFENGKNIQFQLIPDEQPISWSKIKANY